MCSVNFFSSMEFSEEDGETVGEHRAHGLTITYSNCFSFI